MSNHQQSSRDLPRATMAALMLAAFTVSVGYGVVLPLLPYLIERLLGAGVEVAQVSRHTGLLTAVYTLAPFLFALVNNEPNLNINFWYCAAFCYVQFYATGRFPVQSSNKFVLKEQPCSSTY